eukprot:CAMPEP_0174851202 /NCGR_PEP_ID=MMETSP1114-20130205/22242_1 /TAXON_ID=312471 /ORGANISM="Neobodo designis, Strain CCAP 1951/1" /LENGTH=371 /DNA_ID=CAMNT_0016085723 /DNA_START=48 /DNA_END=1161 /DNA_ORIENTATION=+
MPGRRELVDDKAVLSEVSKLLHAAKANKKIIVNARKTAKLAAAKGIDASAAPTPAPAKKSAKKGEAPAQAIPANAVLRKGGGSVWVMLKCAFDAEARRARDEAREAQGKPVKEFVLPATNTRYQKRMAKWEAAAEAEAAEAAAEEEEEAPAEAEAEEAADGDDVADAPAEEEAAPSRTQTLLSAYGNGASKCIVRTKSSAARKVKRRALPAPEGAKSADSAVRAKAESAERRRCRQRRVKQQKATSVLASQKVATNFTTQLVALLRKEVYPNMKRSPAPDAAASGAAAPAAAGAKHKDPNAEAGNQAAPKQQASQQKSGGGKKGSGKGGKKKYATDRIVPPACHAALRWGLPTRPPATRRCAVWACSLFTN